MPGLDWTVLLRDDHPQMLFRGLLATVTMTGVTWLLAMALGTALTLLRMAPSRLAQTFVAAWVEFHQNVPILVHLFLWYFGIASLLPMDLQRWINQHAGDFIFSTLALGFVMSAYVSECLRGGIRSIPKSQVEAARALGLSYLQAFRWVILPQAFRIALPTFISLTVLLFKNTSLAMTIGMLELTYVVREIESRTFKTVEAYLFATVVYLALSLLIMWVGSRIERRTAVPGR